MFHALKKTLSWYKPTAPTQDPRFEEAWAAFKPVLEQCQALLTLFDTNDKIRDELSENFTSTLSMVHDAGGQWSQASVVSTEGLRRLAELDAPLPGVGVSQEARPVAGPAQQKYNEARDLLVRYRDLLLDVRKVVLRREELVKELDYYRGKVQYFTEKVTTKPKELEAAKTAMGKAMDVYTKVNNLAVDNMHSALDLKDQALLVSLGAFMHMQREYAANVEYFAAVTESHPELSHAKWPDLSPLQTAVKYQIVEYKCTAVDEEAIVFTSQSPSDLSISRKSTASSVASASGGVVGAGAIGANGTGVGGSMGARKNSNSAINSVDSNRSSQSSGLSFGPTRSASSPPERSAYGRTAATDTQRLPTQPSSSKPSTSWVQDNPILTPPVLPTTNHVASKALMDAEEDEEEEILDEVSNSSTTGGGVMYSCTNRFDNDHIWQDEEPNPFSKASPILSHGESLDAVGLTTAP
eukprot:comp12469_c0_seq1/m.7409 comp12469_c0_seq1/g.7409  ORF comp12469_c0_seq1/g.7409 comp12469_c0_seq1/m.7409 type:complete len:467 (-) comp12469_c0_seq1:432-1832(-)